MSLSDVAPRLARARDQVVEIERVLGWIRDNSWTGGVYVLVPTQFYGEYPDDWTWIHVGRVTTGATPYPIKDQHGRGQWAMWEVADMRLLSDDFPELILMQPEYPSYIEPVFA